MLSMENISEQLKILMKRIIIHTILLLFATGLFAQDRTSSDYRTLLQEGRFTDARAVIERLTMDGETSDELLYLKALLSLDANTASTLYHRLIEQHPQSVYNDNALFRLAQLNYAQGLYQTSLNSFSRVLEDHPQSSFNIKCYFWIGLCYQAIGQLDSASTYFQLTSDYSQSPDLANLAKNELNRIQNEVIETDLPDQSQTSPKYSVQVGAFTNQVNALNNKDFYEKEGYSVRFGSKMKNGRQMYLVLLGSFETREEARKFGELILKKYTLKEYMIVSNQPGTQ